VDRTDGGRSAPTWTSVCSGTGHWPCGVVGAHPSLKPYLNGEKLTAGVEPAAWPPGAAAV